MPTMCNVMVRKKKGDVTATVGNALSILVSGNGVIQ